MNISFPVLNVQGHAIAGLTVPYVKRIEDKVSVSGVVASLRRPAKRYRKPWAPRRPPRRTHLPLSVPRESPLNSVETKH